MQAHHTTQEKSVLETCGHFGLSYFQFMRDHPHLCLSLIFVIPMRSGKLWIILNIKIINTFNPLVHFQMETLASILPMIERTDWATSLDLREAYFHIPISIPARGISWDSLSRARLSDFVPFHSGSDWPLAK